MRDVTAATLQKYGEGDIDGIWCCYDAYAQGVYQALREANSDIPMREYLYELKHNPSLITSIIPLGDGVTVSVKQE